MTVFVTGGTGKTGFSLFLTHRNQIEKREKIFSVFNRECQYPGLSGFSGKAAFCPADMEKDIVAAILRYLKGLPRCFAWKTHGGMYGTAGIPDIIACVQGRFYAFEVKQPGGRLSRLQDVTLKKIEAAGGVAVMVTSVDEVKSALAGKGEE
ncbi:VRR-NUC domain-containing protein [Lachnospiraceae bacterium 45-W7]